jgi:hypothetical protein
MDEIKTINVPLYYIETYKKNTDRLQDISETGYPTLELCQAAIELQIIQDKEFEQELLEQYEEDMKSFVLDLDTSDMEPIDPRKIMPRFTYAPHLYIHDENGHHEVTEHVINDLNLLQATPELIESINYILNGTIDPETFKSVQMWVAQCYNKPDSNALKLAAINEALGGYGIESVRTSKWQNGHWCDIPCTYVNLGDSYIPTVVHHRKHGFMVACIGDVIEKNKHVI